MQYQHKGVALVTAVDALGNKTLYSYHHNGDLASATDPEGRATRFA